MARTYQTTSALALPLLIALSGSLSAQAEYEFIDLGNLGVNGLVRPMALNNQGVAVGAAPFGSGFRPFIWNAQQGMQVLQGVNQAAIATAINDSGVVAGEIQFPGGARFEAFRWDAGMMENLGMLAGDDSSIARGIFGDGTIIGDSGQSGGVGGVLSPDSFVAPGSTLQLLLAGARSEGASSDGLVTGQLGSSAFLLNGQQVTDLGVPGGPGEFDLSRGLDVNNAGQVAGFALDPAGFAGGEDRRGYVWSGGNAIRIPVADSSAFAINEQGMVVGGSDQGPFLFDVNTGEVRFLATLVNLPGGTALDDALDINDAGQILGRTQGGGAFLLDPIGLGETFCVAATNSTGSGAMISAEGSASLAANNLTLNAGPVPSGPGIFFFGSTQVQIPFGNGFRCAGGMIERLSPVVNSTGSMASLSVDFGLTSLASGQTRFFQFWFRDPAAGGANFNLSNGLELTLLP